MNDVEKNLLESVTEFKDKLESGEPLITSGYAYANNSTTTNAPTLDELQRLIDLLPSPTKPDGYPIIWYRDRDEFDDMPRRSEIVNYVGGRCTLRRSDAVPNSCHCIIAWYSFEQFPELLRIEKILKEANDQQN